MWYSCLQYKVGPKKIETGTTGNDAGQAVGITEKGSKPELLAAANIGEGRERMGDCTHSGAVHLFVVHVFL